MADAVAIRKFEDLFSAAARLDIDKSDVRRLNDVINTKLHELLLAAQARAKTEGRDLIRELDLPLTLGLQKHIRYYENMEEQFELEAHLENLTLEPPMNLGYSAELADRLPVLFGGLTVALARTFRTLYPELKNPSSDHWTRATEVFGLLL